MAPATASLPGTFDRSKAKPPKAALPKAALPEADADVAAIVRELAGVADYIAHIKREIGALRANELCRDRLPMANEELGCVVQATAGATHTIMSAAEEILGSEAASLDAYRAGVEAKVFEIFEACSFQDITGQRIAKVLEALRQVEKRLNRFTAAVNARDAQDALDPEDALRQARREVLLLNGPQSADKAIGQDDIDALFD
jgi:chemotaxis protein CheZ